MVAQGRLAPGKRSNADQMVREKRADQPDPPVFSAEQLKETAWYGARMPGGVRGGGREAPLYSIWPRVL